MDTATLFVRTLEDIERRLRDGTDDYEVLLIAGLLRKLFLDSHPLVDQVNQSRRVKLGFEVTIPTNKPEDGDLNSLWFVQDGLDPDTAPPHKRREVLSRDQFFRQTVTMVNGRTYSAKDIVLFEANIAGAVHAGAATREKEQVLESINATFAIGGYASSLRQLQAIARVSLKALQPLRDAVSAG